MVEYWIGIPFLVKQTETLQKELSYSDMTKEEKLGYLYAIRDMLKIITNYQNRR